MRCDSKRRASTRTTEQLSIGDPHFLFGESEDRQSEFRNSKIQNPRRKVVPALENAWCHSCITSSFSSEDRKEGHLAFAER